MIKFASKNIYVITKYYHQCGNHKFCRQYIIFFQSEQQTNDEKNHKNSNLFLIM